MWRTLFHLMRADLLERSRRSSVLVTLGVVVALAFLFVPSADAKYLTLSLGNHRGVYNSAWVGASVAVLCSALLSLPAFYLVKNAIARDERTRVGQIIATTPLTRSQYVLGKAFSNFAFLSLMVGVIALAAAGMQLVRGEDMHLEPWPLLAPFIFGVLPVMAVIAALAITFETIPLLRGATGNVVYLFLWLVVVSLSAAGWPSDPRAIAEPTMDLLGIPVILSDMMKAAVVAFPEYTGTNPGVGVFPLSDPLQTFTWEGISWTPDIIGARLIWVAAAIGLSMVGALFFRRFDPAPLRPGRTGRVTHKEVAVKRAPQFGDADPDRVAQAEPAAAVRLSPVAAGFKPRFGALLVAELRIMLKAARWWWFAGALVLIVASALATGEFARYVVATAWLWPVALWSPLGSREVQHNVRNLVFNAPRLSGRQLPALWLSGILMALATGSGVAVRYMMEGEPTRLLALAAGAAFIASLALALGTWSSGSMPFEVVYAVWWWLGPVQGMSALDFMGVNTPAGTLAPLMYLIGALALLGVAFLGRRRQTRIG